MAQNKGWSGREWNEDCEWKARKYIERSEKCNISSQKNVCIVLFVLAVLAFTIHILLCTLRRVAIERAHHHQQCTKWFTYATTEHCEFASCYCLFVPSFVHGYSSHFVSSFSLSPYFNSFNFAVFVSCCSSSCYCLSGCCIAIAAAPTRDASCVLHVAHTLYYECKWCCFLRNMVQQPAAAAADIVLHPFF